MPKRHPTYLRALLLTAAMLVVTSAGCGNAAGPDVNFQQVIARAKSSVYPALVFVKPIREDFRSGQRERAEVFGSGVILTADGYLVTNNHVAANAVQVNCVLGDRQQVPATVVGLDPETDLALLKLQLPADAPPLPTADLADSDAVSEGEFVMALGSPFGFSRSISLGILSNTKRYLGFDGEFEHNLWLQTDAAINPGNSGGPLVDTDGKIVGINTLGLRADGIGFAIPANVVADITSRLKAKADAVGPDHWPVHVDRAYAGVQLQALRDFNTNTFTDGVLEAGRERGVLVRNVEAFSPAAMAGVRAGDLLLKINGQWIEGRFAEQLPALRRTLAKLAIDRPARWTVARDGKRQTLAVTPTLKGKVEGADLELRRWNMTVKEITRFSNPTLYFQHGEGVYVQGVRYPGCAAESDLADDDVIVQVDSTPIKTLDDAKRVYQRLLAERTGGDRKVLVVIKRNGFRMPRVLDWTADYLHED